MELGEPGFNRTEFATLKGTPQSAVLSTEAQRELEHFRAQHEAADDGFTLDLQRVLRRR